MLLSKPRQSLYLDKPVSSSCDGFVRIICGVSTPEVREVLSVDGCIQIQYSLIVLMRREGLALHSGMKRYMTAKTMSAAPVTSVRIDMDTLLEHPAWVSAVRGYESLTMTAPHATIWGHLFWKV